MSAHYDEPMFVSPSATANTPRVTLIRIEGVA